MAEEDELRMRLEELLARSRESGEKLLADAGKVLDSLRGEVGQQLGRMGLATREDLVRLEQKIDDLAAATTAAEPVAPPEKPGSAESSSKAGEKASGKKSKAGGSGKKPAAKKPAARKAAGAA